MCLDKNGGLGNLSRGVGYMLLHKGYNEGRMVAWYSDLWVRNPISILTERTFARVTVTTLYEYRTMCYYSKHPQDSVIKKLLKMPMSPKSRKPHSS